MSMRSHSLVALLTDFGMRDGYVGVMKGVMLGIAPEARLVDLTHEIPPQDVRAGAWVLATSWRAFSEGTVFLCVVDPGVGTERRAIALRAGERLFVGPDNGIFSYVLADVEAERVVVLDKPLYHLPTPTSATFHGRDIFAPCAAHLARGILLDVVGTPLATADTLVRLPLARPMWREETLVGHVVHIDVFGNLITDFDPMCTDAILAAPAVSLHIREQRITTRAATFGAGPEGQPFMLRDSSGHLALAVRNGSAQARTGATVGDEITLTGVQKTTGDRLGSG